MAERLSKSTIESVLDAAKKRGVMRGEFKRGLDSFSFDFAPTPPSDKSDGWDKACG